MPSQVINKTLISNAALAATTTSDMINLSQSTSLAIQAVYSGTFSYSIQYQSSNDGVNWTNEGSAIAITSAGSTMTKFADVGFVFLRASISKTSGTVNLSIIAAAK